MCDHLESPHSPSRCAARFTPPCGQFLAKAMSKKTGVFLYATFNLSALLHLAGQLRNIPCSCNSSQQPESGSLSWAIFLSFEDGVKWVFLSPRKSHDISPETTAKWLESSVATMKYIKLNSAIPVPEVFQHRCVFGYIPK